MSLPTLLLLIVLVACQNVLTAINNGESSDVADVIFPEDSYQSEDNLCTEEYPSNLNVSEVLSETAVIKWMALNIENITGYEVLFWPVYTSTYQSINVSLVSMTTLTSLQGFTDYYVTVRGRCGSHQYGVASPKIRFTTKSRAPDEAVVITFNGTLPDYSGVRICWTMLPYSKWNGMALNYILHVTDITPDFSRSLEFYHKPFNHSCLEILSLTFNNQYIAFMQAFSSGGTGPYSNPLVFTFESPPTPAPSIEPSPTSEFNLFTSWMFYAIAIPSAIVLVVIVSLFIVCCKKRMTKGSRQVSYVRDIQRNVTEGKMIVGRFDSMTRFESVRSSQQNRPLPPNPPNAHNPLHVLHSTPSTTSMQAHLIGRDHSPPALFEMNQFYPQVSPGYPSQHHYPMESEPRLRSASITSPHQPGPTLSQPLSDISSVTPSSVFTESNLPHPDNRNPFSPNNPVPYEIPNVSESGHHSVSPPAHMHSISNPHRPHTATGVVPHTAVGVLSSHHSSHQHNTALTQSNMELFELNAPPIPPHRAHSNAGLIHSPNDPFRDNHSASPRLVRPESGLYSEIPTESGEPVISGPIDTKHRGLPLNSMGGANSPVSSDQYSSYSDIPTACSPALKEQNIEEQEKKDKFSPHLKSYPSNGQHSPGHSSLSDSISSFSTDSQSRSPSREKGSVHKQLSPTKSSSSQHRHSQEGTPIRQNGGDLKSNALPRTNSKSSHVSSHFKESKESESPSAPAPYLSPASLKGHPETRTTPPSQ